MHGLWHRLGATLLAIWFVVNIGEPQYLRTCPVYGAGHGSGKSAEQGGHGGHGSMGHGDAPPASASNEMASHHRSESDAPEQHGCHCASHCSSASVLSLPAESSRLVDELVAAGIIRGVPAEPVLASASAEHVLPFATAPPVRLS